MKKGLLLTNAFLHTHKFVEHYEWLRDAAKKRDVELDCVDNTYALTDMADPMDWLNPYSFVVFWDKDIRLGEHLQQACKQKGIHVYNSVESIAACDDKYETYIQLHAWNLSVPKEEQKLRLLKTIAAPMTYANIGYTSLDFVSAIVEKLGLPLVIKECFGSFGMQVYLAQDMESVIEWTQKLAGTPFLYQQYLTTSSGRDVRLQVVGDRVVAAMRRQAKDGDFRANITNGGSMQCYEPTEKEQEIAVDVCQALGLDFSGVDLLFDEEGQATIVCEVNSNAHFRNIHTCTGVNVADDIMEYICK